MSGLRSLIREIHRRSLWQILAIYAVGSWVVLQVVDVMADNVGLPSWTFPFALVLLLLGLPIVLATAFIQEGVGARPEAPAGDAVFDTGAGARVGLLTWRNAMFGGVGAFALWGAVAAGWMVVGDRPARGGGADDLRAIAVLPFEARSEGEGSDAEFFAAGMHDDLLTQLAKIDSLTVISRTSVMQYADADKSIPEIAAELGVKVVLEGSVQRSGTRIRVNAQLIEAATDRHLWAETYNEELTAANVFAIQSDLAREIARALRATLSPDAARRIGDRPTENLAAYDLYNRARAIMDRRGGTRGGLDQAHVLFEAALALDSTFAEALVGLGVVEYNRAVHAIASWAEVRPLVQAAAERALALDPELAEAHSLLSKVLRREGRLTDAERSVLRALELNPGSGSANAEYSALLLQMNRFDEAIEAGRRTVDLDPLNIQGRAVLLNALSFAARSPDVLEEAGRILALDSSFADAWYLASYAHVEQGDGPKAIAAMRRALELEPDDPYYPAGLAYVFAMNGQRDSAETWIVRADLEGAPIKEIALVRGALGELDEAFRLLDRALETEPEQVRALDMDYTSKPLRQDPRWEDLMRRAGVSQ